MYTMGSYSLYFTGLILCLLKIFEGIQAGVSCPAHLARVKNSYITVHRDICYLFVNRELYWKRARESCFGLGGEMLTVKDKETMDFIRATLDSEELGWTREGVWLGARYQSRRWRWTDGSLMTYENWASDQPSAVLSVFSVEDCAQMRKEDHWRWHDYICGALRFHYNYVCEFPAEVSNSSTSAALGDKMISKISKMSYDLGQTKPHLTEMTQADDPRPKSDFYYRRLGQNVYRLMEEKGMSSKSLLNLIRDSGMGDNSKDNDLQEQVTSRISNSASSQEDNGNRTIMIIVISLTSGFLLIILIIFLLIRRHNKIVKTKAEERAVSYINNSSNTTNSAGTRAATGPLNTSDTPPVPATRPPPMHDSYLTPKEVTSLYTEVIHPNGLSHTTNSEHQNSCCPRSTGCVQHTSPSSSLPGSDPELGACGGSLSECELTRPLMSGQQVTEMPHQHNTPNRIVLKNPVPSESCSCAANSSQGEYIAMNSIASKDSCEQLNAEEKHTYTNVQMDLRDNAAVENHYEILP